MPKYVAFLRAINVGGHVVKMDRLVEVFESLGYADVSTYIASGNVLFEARPRNAAALESAIEGALERALGYEVTTFVRTRAEVAAIAAHNAFPRAAIERAAAFNVAMLKQPLDAAGVAAVARLRTDIDDFHLNGAELYWLCARRQMESKFSNALFERTVRARATFRGLRTMTALAAKHPA